ncbi:lytic transglycosylase domain-containing protein [Treponema sp.]|uniref:lytic transglycosylase domain-containing protein n=1 Tax=Treponema sp. TaxID=166 RepID=UPI003F03E067
MKKLTFKILFSALIVFPFFSEEPVADFSLDMSYFEKKQESVESEKPAREKTKGYVFPEPKRKDIGISGVFKEQTVKYRERYLSAGNRQWLADVLYDSIPYRPYIRAKLKEKKMPLYLQYLPIIESNYKPTAVSSSGATGLWQFMANSMSPYLTKNEYFDERRDPWKETDAALSKLAENYKTFGDWHLAIAAYNMGAGAVGRIVKANPGKDYWALAEKGLLSKQASEYIPKLIAIADIVENADFYGAIEVGAADMRIDGAAPEKFSYLTVKGSIRLATIAQAAGLSLETVKMLNIELLRDSTPPKTVYKIRLPAGKAKTAAENLRK